MIYVSSDLHGCPVEKFEQLLQQASFGKDDFLFILGDVIDRGQHGVALLRWIAEQPNVQLILGNHEAMLLSCQFLFDEITQDTLAKLTTRRLKLVDTWLRNGGSPTLNSLQRLLKDEPEIFRGILELLQDAPFYDTVEAGGKHFLLVHSGLNHFSPDKPLDDYTLHDLLWTRPTPQDRYYEDRTVIFGHTPTEFLDPAYRGRAYRTDTWICIDSGAATGGFPMLLRLDDGAEFYL